MHTQKLVTETCLLHPGRRNQSGMLSNIKANRQKNLEPRTSQRETICGWWDIRQESGQDGAMAAMTIEVSPAGSGVWLSLHDLTGQLPVSKAALEGRSGGAQTDPGPLGWQYLTRVCIVVKTYHPQGSCWIRGSQLSQESVWWVFWIPLLPCPGNAKSFRAWVLHWIWWAQVNHVLHHVIVSNYRTRIPSMSRVGLPESRAS